MSKYYDGKVYDVLTMGIQYTYSNPEFLLTYNDMATWVYGILALI